MTDARHRDVVMNYFHSQGVLIADFVRSGAGEKSEERAELERLIQGFKKPAGAAPGEGEMMKVLSPSKLLDPQVALGIHGTPLISVC